MSTSRRFHLVLPASLEADITDFARSRGLGMGPALRLLASTALDDRTSGGANSPASLAALVAAELAVLMVASILPEGEQRMRALAHRATQSAEERLAAFQEQPAAPEGDGR